MMPRRSALLLAAVLPFILVSKVYAPGADSATSTALRSSASLTTEQGAADLKPTGGMVVLTDSGAGPDSEGIWSLDFAPDYGPQGV